MASNVLSVGPLSDTKNADNTKAQKLIETLTEAWGWPPTDPETGEPTGDTSPQARLAWFHVQLWDKLQHEAWQHNRHRKESAARDEADAERSTIGFN